MPAAAGVLRHNTGGPMRIPSFDRMKLGQKFLVIEAAIIIAVLGAGTVAITGYIRSTLEKKGIQDL